MHRHFTLFFYLASVVGTLCGAQSASAESEYDMFRGLPASESESPTTAKITDASCAAGKGTLDDLAGISAYGLSPAQVGAMLPVNFAESELRVITAQFQPTLSRQWYGNLKRYGITNTVIESSQSLALMSEGASTPATGACDDGRQQCLSPNARSAWTTSIREDGDVAVRGGAADQLPRMSSRQVMLQSGGSIFPLAPIAGVASLKSHEAAVVARIARKLGWKGTHLPADTAQPSVVSAVQMYNRLAGIDANNVEYTWLSSSAQQPYGHREHEISWFGATVFGSPVHVRYDASPAHERNVIWWSTTDGFLRATDAASGEELSAVLPEAVVESVVASNPFGFGDVLPGLDTSWVALRHDQNQDGKIEKSDGDYVYLYGGMRRGGNHLFGWDVTDPVHPSVLFELSPKQAGFEALANTWSTPVLLKTWWSNSDQPESVLVFGGGYDNRLDSPGASETSPCVTPSSECGAAVYMVKATGSDAGRLLWSLSGDKDAPYKRDTAAISQPVVAPIRSLDINGDGVTDVLYVLELSGRLHRIQMPQKAGVSPQARLVADLSAHADDAIDSAFFQAPGITTALSDEGILEAVLVLGSGNIAQPFSSTRKGRLFVVRDSISTQNTSDPSVLTPASAQVRWLGSVAGSGKAMSTLWVLPELGSGEKLAASPTVVDGKAFYSTFLPPENCHSKPGTQRLWAVDIESGAPIFDTAGGIDARSATDFVRKFGSVPTSSRFSLLMVNQHWSMLNGLTAVASSRLASGPQKVRWRQMLTGPDVREKLR